MVFHTLAKVLCIYFSEVFVMNSCVIIVIHGVRHNFDRFILSIKTYFSILSTYAKFPRFIECIPSDKPIDIIELISLLRCTPFDSSQHVAHRNQGRRLPVDQAGVAAT